jgi:hypothetical protein
MSSPPRPSSSSSTFETVFDVLGAAFLPVDAGVSLLCFAFGVLFPFLTGVVVVGVVSFASAFFGGRPFFLLEAK